MDEDMNRRGITLMELVIVMAIIALGAVLMVPNIGAWLPNYRLRSAARDTVSIMRVAQMKAVSRNMDHRVSFDPGNGSYFIMRRTTAGVNNWVRIGLSDEPAAGADDAKQFLPSGVQFDAANFMGNNYAEFNPNSTASGGRVVLKNSKGTQRTVRVLSTTGKVTIE
jgi:prepilin-type N-terminal cleavage/methylation domain-containing protein